MVALAMAEVQRIEEAQMEAGRWKRLIELAAAAVDACFQLNLTDDIIFSCEHWTIGE